MTNKQIETMLSKVEAGQPVLMHLKRVSGGKVSLEVAEKIQGEENLVGLLNKEDDRFNQQRFRLAWISGTPKSCIREFGLNVTEKQIEALTVATGIPDDKLEEGKTKINLGILNPVVAGKSIHVQIEEFLAPQYETHEAKRAGAGGDFLTFGGKLIYTSTRVVSGNANHLRIAHDGRVPAGAYGKFDTETTSAARAAFVGVEEPTK